MFYGNRLVVNSFKDLPESALEQLQRHGSGGQQPGPLERVQQLQLGQEDYTSPTCPWKKAKTLGKPDCGGGQPPELDPALLTLKLVIFGVGTAAAFIAGLLSFWLSSGMRRQIAHLAEGTRRATQEELRRGYSGNQPG